MIKVLLLAVLFNTHTGELGNYISPLPGFTTMDECLVTRANLFREKLGGNVQVHAVCIQAPMTKTTKVNL